MQSQADPVGQEGVHVGSLAARGGGEEEDINVGVRVVENGK